MENSELKTLENLFSEFSENSEVLTSSPGSAGPDCLSRLEQGSPDPLVNDEGYFDREVY